MTLNPIDDFFFSLEEPERSCLLFIRQYILDHKTGITEHRHYNTPFYYYKERWMAYISYHPKTKVIYIGFVHGYKLKHKKLLSEGRKKVKVFYLNAYEDVDVKSLNEILTSATEYLQAIKKN